MSSTNVTKYCACHEKWLASLILVTRETSFTMRGTTGITLQPHQMLCLPRKMTRIIDPRDIWNVIYNARSNRHHPPTSPNTAPATQNDSHDWCPSHMTRHLQCAEQQISSSNITKCCACHAKWLASSIRVTYETLFTMRGGTGIIHQPHQILRLPRKMTRIIYPRDIWNVISNARSNRHLPPTWPNTAPATQNCTPKTKKNAPKTAEASIPMRGRFEHDPSMIRAWSDHELVISHPPVRGGYFSRFGDAFCIENYNISRSGYLPRFHRILRLPRKVTLRHHQILRLPRKMTLMIDVRHIWNVISNARSNRHLPPTWPNTAPATQNCTPKTKKNAPKTAEASIPMRGRFEHDPSMIRAWSDHELVISHPPVRGGYFSRFGDAFCIENYNISRSGYLPRFHRILRLPRKVTLRHHQILRLPRKMTLMIDVRHIWNVISNARSNRHLPPTWPNTAPATQNCTPKTKKNAPKTAEASIPMRGRFEHDPSMIRAWSDHELVISHPPVRGGYFSRFGDAFCIENYNISRSGYLPRFHRILRLPRKVPLQDDEILRLPRKVTLQDHQILRLPRKVTLRHHQILRLPRKVTMLLNCYWTELLLSWYWAVTKLLLSCYWTVTELTCYWTVTGLSLNCYWTDLLLSCYWPVTELSCYWTELWLNCYWTVTELLLNWPVTERLLTCYWTELLLNCYWTVTELNCYWAVTELSCYWTVTELNCYWTVTGLSLNCYWTDLLLSCYWTELLLNCYWTVTELLLNWPVTELLLNWAVTELNCYWTVTELSLNCYWTDLLLSCYWAELLLSCYWTELLLNCHWTVTELTCYWAVTELSCYWAVTELNCYWTVTGLSLNCYWTDLLLSCYWTELLLNCYWTVTELLLNCYWTDLLLSCYWTVTLHCYLNCYCTGLFAFLNLRNSEVSQLNFLWLLYIIIYIYMIIDKSAHDQIYC